MERITDAEYEKRKKILEFIKIFTRPEQEEVYRILKRNGEDISENRNGMFFDIAVLKPSTIQGIENWIEFCRTNREMFEKRNAELEAIKREEGEN
jgi:hypothetical protein